ncbi:10645_t:CDS:10, partial [Racocetra fulgida]
QEKHYYLTFFPARHILAFYDYFTNKDDPNNVGQILNNEECRTLIRFVNSEAKLPPRSAEFIISSEDQNYYQILCQIGTKLQNIFESVPKKRRDVIDKGGRIMSDVVYQGKLFVAACSDKNLVPNIIMKLLDFELQYNLVNNIRSMRKEQTNYHLALICCRETGMHHHILDQFSQEVYATNGLGIEAMKVIYRELRPDNVLCLSSDLSGQGKSEYIRQSSFACKKVPRSFLISDGVDFGTLVHQFKEFKVRPVESLHINIVSADHPVDVNMFLFELLTLGVVSNNMDIAYLPDTIVFIEVASTVNQHLLKSLPMVECLNSKHLTWDIGELMVSQEINSPMQVVCHYLLAYDTNTLDNKDIVFQVTNNDTPLVPLSSKQCQPLIEKYLFKNKKDDISSFRFVEIFVNVLADQLVRLSSSSFFECENLKLMIKDTNIRTTLVNTLIDVSKDFATRSVKTKVEQLISTSTDENARLGTIVQWDDSNHLLVFFLSQTPDSICALYRDKAKVPQNVRTLLKSQHIGDKSWELEDYHKMTTNELLETLECLARKTMYKIEYPPYALSADNLVKMALILLRARANIPVVICGEAGCGKTSLIGFLAKVVEVEFQPLNLHAGVTESAILNFMNDAQDKAENEQSNLVYQVKPLPDQILDYVWDYGVLQQEEERRYIEIMVSDSLKDFGHECLVFAELLFESQAFIRDVEEPYSVSLRDRKKINVDEKAFNKVIRQEQDDYINRMTCPPNTAKNEALLENVLVMIVCILTKIPVFIIGAPGSSKSLAIRLVSQNLRGSDSNDEYFRKLPQVYLIPHQGSSSSTSDGILKVFQKAQNYQETSSKEFPVISVVLLDEVGLAETSPFNPLKVLHSLLEPSYPSEGTTVSVIGISNWRLDNTVRLLSSKTNGQISKASLQPLAQAYSDYEQHGQSFPNFHGLRDYYALVKSLSLGDMTAENIQMALVRNFGGTDQNVTLCEKYFGEVLRTFNNSRNWIYNPIPVEKLINANLDDEGARHLMVIGKSDSIVNLLTYQLRKRNLDPVVILGSQFPDDQDDYSYSVLKAGRPLILTDLEIIYGSLYDLWNQNYIVVGSAEDPKYYTRVALGAYANPMLCILVLDEKKLKHADPPLLNRFEKQKMTINDTLSKHEVDLVQQLSNWAMQMVTVFGKNKFDPNAKFSQKDLFIGFDPDETLQSLVIDIKKSNPHSNDDEILEKCKENLIAIASSDGIIRAEKSILDPEEITHWKNVYFKKQHHDNLADQIQALLDNLDEFQVIINTFSNINTDVKACLKGIINCQVDKLSTFKTESQLQNRIKHFWLESTDQLLVLQCDVTTVNAGCIKLAKFIIEQFRNEFFAKKEQKPDIKVQKKHACIILHIHREQETSLASFNFMCGWNQVTIETLLPQEKPLSILLNGSLCDIINTTYPFEDILEQELLWSQTQEWLQNHSPANWQYIVASDKKLLYPYASFSIALQAHIRRSVRKPIARILCALERLSVTRTFFSIDKSARSENDNRLLEFWMKMFNDKKIIDIKELPEPSPDSYMMPPGVYDLQFPFSYYFMKQIDGFKALYLEEMTLLHEDPMNIDSKTGELRKSVEEEHIKEFTNKVLNMVPLLKTSPIDWASILYFKDFVTVIAYNEPGDKDPALIELIFEHRLRNDKILNPILLHTCWWKHGDSIISELRLAQMCPTLVKQLQNESHIIFEQFLVEGASRMMLQKICNGAHSGTIHYGEIINWQHDVTQILSLSKKISGSSASKSLQLLQISNDLISTRSITRSTITQIISLGQNNNFEEFLSWKFVDAILVILNKLEKSEKNLNSQRAFILRCLDIIPPESSVRLDLYRGLFSQIPFPLMGAIISKIFKTEEEENNNVFFRLIHEPTEILTISQKLSVINSSLKITDLNSEIAALCCDIIQLEFFWEFKLNQLAPYFRKAASALYSSGVQPLQRIASIAFLKEFVRRLWDSMIPEGIDQAIKFPTVGFNPFSGPALLEDINSSMSLTHPLIHSLKIYFLRDLRQRGYAIDDVKKFGEVQAEMLPWFNSFSWDNDDESRLPFNPYWSVPDYAEVEKAFSNLYNFNNKAPLNKFLDRIRLNDSIDARIAIIGIIVSKLHAFRASRNLVDVEKQAADYINQAITEISDLPEVYKQTVARLLINKYPLFQLSPQTSSSELIMKSVIIHIIGVHASLSSDSSPLAAYLHKLQECQNQYILACPSDIESVVFNGAVTQSKCPECKNTIGGTNYNAAAGNRRLDTTPISSNDWNVLKQILDVSDENLALLIHLILTEMVNNPPTQHNQILNTAASRNGWEKMFSQTYVIPKIRSVTEATTNFRTQLDQAIRNAQVTSNILEGEINQTLPMDEGYCRDYLPRIFRSIAKTSFESFRAYYNRDIKYNTQAFPLLDIYFKHYEKLPHIKNLYPIVKFVQMLASRFEYRLTRKEASQLTFKDFIEGQSSNGQLQETYESLSLAFNDFANAWNETIDHVTRYQCHPLPDEKPYIDINSNIVFGLMEGRDTGIYLCAILEYLITLQNNFLQEVMTIPGGSCPSLNFLRELSWVTYENVSSSFTNSTPALAIEAQSPYFIQSKKLDTLKETNFINYTWDKNILQYSQHNLGIGRGRDIIYDLQKIEMELAYQLVAEKVHIAGGAEQQLYLEPFTYSMELFQGSMRILGEIKAIIPQEPIPSDKLSLIIGTSNNPFAPYVYQQPSLSNYFIDNASELFSFLEILICFIKRTSIGDGNLLIKDFVNQWMKLSILAESTGFKSLLGVDLQLKHVIALYELVEEQIANMAIKYIHEKFRVPLRLSMENEIMNAIDFDQKSTQQQRLPAEAFTIALKRFMQRFLSVENNKNTHPLYTYFTDMTLSLWPSDIDEELVEE